MKIVRTEKYYSGHDKMRKVTINMSENEFVQFSKLVKEKFTSTNTGSPKLPTMEEVYRAIPFPEDERECAMFVAGLAECHEYIVDRQNIRRVPENVVQKF